MKQRILITGGSGLLALNWAQAMKDRCDVTLGLHNRMVSLAGTKVKTINLASVDQLVDIFEKNKCQVIIHTAALTSIEQCESEPDLAKYVNVTLAANVAQACNSLGIKMVHISTDHLFSGEEQFVNEDHPVSPVNIYAKTKADAEIKVQESNLQALVIRTNFYGWGTSYRQSLTDVILEKLRGPTDFTLFQDIFFTPILAERLAYLVHDLIDLNANGIFNVVGDERISKYEFGIKIANEFGYKFNCLKKGFFLNENDFVRRPRDMSLSNLKITNFLGRPIGDVKEHTARLHHQEAKHFSPIDS